MKIIHQDCTITRMVQLVIALLRKGVAVASWRVHALFIEQMKHSFSKALCSILFGYSVIKNGFPLAYRPTVFIFPEKESKMF